MELYSVRRSLLKGIEPCVKNWVKPITLARHAYGDIYKNTEFYIDKPGDAYLVFEGEDGEERKELIQHFDGAGVLRGMHNLDDSVKSFARSCLIMHWTQSRMYGSEARIPFPKHTMEDLKRFSSRSLMQSLRINLRKPA